MIRLVLYSNLLGSVLRTFYLLICDIAIEYRGIQDSILYDERFYAYMYILYIEICSVSINL